uniref:Uncharacterized protein n=1 Tax=Prevotella sp. GTC17259 TaxID=3236795 RepID=A0AB33JCE6_9BACT
MTTHPLWEDTYWLILLQLYLKKPVGVKALYSKALVDVGMELHIHPAYLYQQMFHIRTLDTPGMKKLWDTYAVHPKRLAREVKRLQAMRGFGRPDDFYEGVGIHETFETDFRPVAADSPLTPAMLIMTLDLYFRLTPITMVEETPEVAELATLMGIDARHVVEAMEAFQLCDPYLSRPQQPHALLEPCRHVWNRYGNGNPEELSSMAAQLSAYFKE